MLIVRKGPTSHLPLHDNDDNRRRHQGSVLFRGVGLEHLGPVLYRLPTYLFQNKLDWFPSYLPLHWQELLKVAYLPT